MNLNTVLMLHRYKDIICIISFLPYVFFNSVTLDYAIILGMLYEHLISVVSISVVSVSVVSISVVSVSVVSVSVVSVSVVSVSVVSVSVVSVSLVSVSVVSISGVSVVIVCHILYTAAGNRQHVV